MRAAIIQLTDPADAARLETADLRFAAARSKSMELPEVHAIAIAELFNRGEAGVSDLYDVQAAGWTAWLRGRGWTIFPGEETDLSTLTSMVQVAIENGALGR
jgi:hypothetical protein